MSSIDEALTRLVAEPVCGYCAGGPPATEPTALAAMALVAGGHDQSAGQALDWLAEIQSDEGSLGIDAANPHPRWATGWAVLAWQTALASTTSSESAQARWSAASDRAVDWMRSLFGVGVPRVPILGHNTALRGWPWVETTHSWIEPTAINVMALKATGHGDGPRVREAVELLLDRMLPDGGWNYGNTTVLDSLLRPHIQPTGLALAALHGEAAARRHVATSIDYLSRALSGRTPTASLCYAILGAAAWGHQFPEADAWLEAACRQTLERDASPCKLALAQLAALGRRCPWFDERAVA